MRNKQRLTPLHLFAVAALAGIALAAYSGVIATKPHVDAPAVAGAPVTAYQDPSLAGLRVGPDANPRGDVREYY
jgi:hypothetical protein